MMHTREQFEQFRIAEAAKMTMDNGLRQRALQLISDADKYQWIHQTTWMGEPCLQLPQDMFARHQIIYESKPRVVIEVGVAWGGSTLFYASHPQIKLIICVDTNFPKDLVHRLIIKSPIPLKFIQGSSIDENIFEKVKKELDGDKALIILDSNHTEEHVLKELQLYSQLVQNGQYLICDDTIIEYIEKQAREREWGPGNNPMTALKKFLVDHPEFVQDNRIMDKLLLSCSPGGYVRKIEMDLIHSNI